MALLYIDGFDHYTDVTIKGYQTNAFFTGITTGRFGNGIYQQDGRGYMYRLLPHPIASNSAIVGFAYKFTSPIQSQMLTLGTSASGQYQFSVGMDNFGRMQVARGTSNLGTVVATESTASPMVANAWYYIELKWVGHTSAGSYEVRKNGVTVLSGTGANTLATAGTTDLIRPFGAVGAEGQPILYMDDLYICDFTGSINNDFLGEVRVETIFPTGAGNSTQWTPSTGSNWQNVDEASPNSDTDYNSTLTVNNKDTFAMGDLSTGSGSVYGIQGNYYAKKDEAGLRQVSGVIRSGSSETLGDVNGLSTTYINFMDVYETRPGGGGTWSISDVNAMEAGIKLVG